MPDAHVRAVSGIALRDLSPQPADISIEACHLVIWTDLDANKTDVVLLGLKFAAFLPFFACTP